MDAILLTELCLLLTVAFLFFTVFFWNNGKASDWLLLWGLCFDIFFYLDHLRSSGGQDLIFYVGCLQSAIYCFVTRLIGLGGYLCWSFEIENHMPGIRQRNMMILQWSICPMSCFSLLYAYLFIRWSMNATRAGILGFCLHSQVVYTCLVSALLTLLIFHLGVANGLTGSHKLVTTCRWSGLPQVINPLNIW